MPHLRIFGKGATVRYVPAPEKPGGAGEDRLEPLTHRAVYHRVLRKYAEAAGIDGKSFGPHALRATAATNALDRGADLAQSPGVALGTPTCRPPASTTGAAPAPRTAPTSAWRTERSDLPKRQNADGPLR